MCILCIGSRWSRRIVAMLPWLVIPLVLLWALSQLLPPGFRFEITSPRLACVAVLLVSLAWYEIVMPRLSAWRSRRRALLREKRRIEAQEVAKWRKEATRRCRNCRTPYKDQTPGGGRFMCTYCGHVSKRPVLDVPSAGPVQGVITDSFPSASTTGGLISGLRIISGQNSKIWIARGFPSSFGSARGWIGNKLWLTDGVGWANNGLRFGSPLSGGSLYLGTFGTGFGGLGTCVGGILFGGDRCTTRESYSGIALPFLKLLSVLLVCIGWVWRKLSRAGLAGVGGMNGNHRTCQHRSEDTGPSPVTRGEKARRKAEEKRQARLEKEQLEAEERKQREEVARLVEERRRQRDEKFEAEKESEIGAAVGQEREMKREQEAEGRRQEKAKEREKIQKQIKDREAEDTKRKKGKENEKRSDADKKDEMKLKLLKGSTLDNKGSEPGIKGAANAANSSLKGKHPGSVKAMAVPINKTSFWSRTLSTKSRDVGKSGRAVICGGSSPSDSNMGSGSGEKLANSSKSAWNRIPWTSVWGKATGKVPEDISKERHQGVEIQDNEETSTSARDLLDGTLVLPQKGSVSAQIQPIVPPSHTAESWSNFLSTSSGFPPIELPADRWVCKGNPLESRAFHSSISSSSPSTQVFFEGSSSMGSLLSESYAAAQISEADAMSSLPLSVSGSLNLIDFVSTDMPDPLSLLGPVSQALISSPSSDVQSGPSNTSSNSVPPSVTPFGAVGDVSPRRISGPMDAGANAVPSLLEPWNVPPLTLETTSPAGIWNPWVSPQLDLQKTSVWGNQLQPQSFTSVNYLPGTPPSLENLSSTSNFWPGSHSVKSTLHSWEDSDAQFKIPSDFIDCITHSLMEDPVITADGHSYERYAIEAWLESHDTSPKTGETLPPPPGGNGTGVDKTLRPNHILRGQIIEYKEHLARWFRSQNVHNSAYTAGVGDMYSSSWSLSSNSSLKPQLRGFYPVPGVESVWSYSA